MATKKTQPEDDEPQAADAPTQAADAQPTRLDTTVPGGRYKTADGRVVDCNGEPVKD